MRSVSVLLLAAAAAPLAPQSNPRDVGPASLIIEYRCAPARRPQLLQAMKAGLPRFEEWKRNGMLAGYRLLFSRYVDNNQWDMLALLQFRRPEDAARWRAVEEASPAGLTSDALNFVTAIHTYPADLVRDKEADRPPAHPVYLVVPYTFTVPPAEYVKYADGYVIPQFNGWMAKEVLSGYRLYLQRYTAARPWDSYLVLQYRDDAALGGREKVVAEVRQQLQNNAAWKALADGKQNIRSEKEAIVADELTPEK